MYDANGLRGSKTVNGVKSTYTYVGDNLVYESRSDGKEFYFFYDSYNNLTAIRYISGSTDNYYYVTTNLQGDVLGIYTGGGVLLASYEYDAWGNCTVTSHNANFTIGEDNPIRYRGYYYDSETGLYYLQSRYYDPEIGRFINADNQMSGIGGSPLGHNVFAYCYNSPVNMSDPTGHWPKWASGLLNIASGIAQMTLGAALGVTVGWSGIGAVAAGFLIANGAATATQGVGQVVNAVTQSNVMREDNIIRTGVQTAGSAIAGDTGAAIAGTLYDSAVIVADIYAGSVTRNIISCCFIAGTTVLTALGNKNIEKIESGDWVWSENPETNEKALKQVIQTFVRESYELVHVFANNEEIVTTPEHPFYVANKGWVESIQLRAGDILVLQNGEYVIVEKIQHEILETPITVYNFEVADFHTYYVGNSSVLVHNANCGTNRIVNVSKHDSKIWNNLDNYRNGIKRSGSGSDTKYYSWDNLHNEIEVFNKQGKHLGAMDPVTGDMIKEAVKGRTIDL